MSDPPRPKVPTHDAASPERAALAAMLAEEEARSQRLDAERASVREPVEVLRAKLASRDSPPAAHPENRAPARSPPRSAGEKVKLFRELFRGRDDLYPTRFVSKKTGKAGYAPACSNKFVAGLCELPKVKCGDCANQAFRRVDDASVLRHLRGEHVMGIYPMLPDETCWLLAVDFDKGSWKDDVQAFAETARRAGLLPLMERSLWKRRARLVLLLGTYLRSDGAEDGLSPDNQGDGVPSPPRHGLLRPPLSQPGHHASRGLRKPHRSATSAWSSAGRKLGLS